MSNREPTNEETGKKTERAFPDFIRKGILSGIGGLFGSEEGARSTLGDLKLPKEVINYFMQQFGKAKDELIHRITEEVRDFLGSSHMTEEFKRILHSTSLEINTTVRFKNNPESLNPKVATRWKIVKDAKKRKTNVRRASKKTSS